MSNSGPSSICLNEAANRGCGAELLIFTDHKSFIALIRNATFLKFSSASHQVTGRSSCSEMDCNHTHGRKRKGGQSGEDDIKKMRARRDGAFEKDTCCIHSLHPQTDI